MATQPHRICVFTCIYGGYESMLHEPAPNGLDADYICITDPESQPAVAPNSVWSVRVCEPGLNRYPKLLPNHRRICNACTAKALPSEVFERGSYDTVIHVDANISLADSTLLSEMIQMGTHRFAEIVLSAHPARDCIYEEAAASYFNKYGNNDFVSQTKAYRDEGCPEHVGLYWSGLIVFLDPFGERTIAFGQRYRDELMNAQWAKDPLAIWHPQGQVVLSKLLFDMAALPVSKRKVNSSIRVADFSPVYGTRCPAYVHALRQ